MTEEKIINDSIFGSVRLSKLASSIIETREFQRLNGIKQLGLTYLVFPGANHTRFEHSIGTYYLSQQLGRKIGLSEEEIEQVSIAGLLHDVGHPPYSHSGEETMQNKYGVDHLGVTLKIITGELGHEISDSMDDNFREEVIKILQGKAGVLSRIVSGHGDMDQLDYLSRDSKYTGVALGVVDITRILNTMEVEDNQLCIDEKGLPAIEGLMIARMLMYRSVYRHRIALIGSALINEALKIMDMKLQELMEMNDCDFLSRMKIETPEIYESVKYRKIPRGYILRVSEKEYRQIINDLDGLIMASRFYASPYKPQGLKIITKKGLADINQVSAVLSFLEKELHDEALIAFENKNEPEIRKYLEGKKIEPL